MESCSRKKYARIFTRPIRQNVRGRKKCVTGEPHTSTPLPGPPVTIIANKKSFTPVRFAISATPYF